MGYPDLWKIANMPLIRGLPFGLVGTECYVAKARRILSSDDGLVDSWKQKVDKAGGKRGYVDWLLTDDGHVALRTRYLCPICNSDDIYI